jgi:hypothetical protein
VSMPNKFFFHIFLFLLSSTFLRNAYSETLSDAHVKGLIELKKNNRELAFKFLEKAFDNSNSQLEKSSIAFLLAQAQGYPLKRNRSVYADYALLYGANLDLDEKIRLYTIVGDGYFDVGEISAAESAYRTALKLTQEPNRSREYAIYKLGWILLSQKKPHETYDLWLDWIQNKNDFGLRDAFFKGIGRVWVEAHSRNPKEMLSKNERTFFSVASLSELELGDLAQSIHQGIQRDPPDNLKRMLDLIQNKTLLEKVIRLTYESRTLFANRHCDILTWIKVAPPTEDLIAAAYAELSECAQSVSSVGSPAQIKKNPTDQKKIKLLEIARAYDSLKPKGNQLWPLAEIYSQAGDSSAACEKGQAVILNFIDKPLGSEESENFQQAFLGYLRDCKDLNSPEHLSFGTQLALNKFFFEELATDTKKPETPLLAVLLRSLENPSFRKGFTMGATQNDSLWMTDSRDTAKQIRLWLANLFIKNSGPQGLATALALTRSLSENEKHPIATSLIRIRLSTQAPKLALLELESYLPWQESNQSETFHLWTLLPIQVQTSEAFLEQYSQTLRKGTPLSKDIQALLFLVAQTRSTDLIWKYYDVYGKTLSTDTSFAPIFFDLSLENLSENSQLQLSEWSKKGDLFATRILEIKNALAELDSTRIQSIPPPSLSEHPINEDLRRFRIAYEHTLHFKSLNFTDGPRLGSDIQAAIKRLSNFKTALLKNPWNFLKVKKSAIDCYLRSKDFLSETLEKTTIEDLATQNQIKEIAQTVRGWTIE